MVVVMGDTREQTAGKQHRRHPIAARVDNVFNVEPTLNYVEPCARLSTLTGLHHSDQVLRTRCTPPVGSLECRAGDRAVVMGRAPCLLEPGGNSVLVQADEFDQILYSIPSIHSPPRRLRARTWVLAPSGSSSFPSRRRAISVFSSSSSPPRLPFHPLLFILLFLPFFVLVAVPPSVP